MTIQKKAPYYFSVAAIINYHKFCSLKNCKKFFSHNSVDKKAKIYFTEQKIKVRQGHISFLSCQSVTVTCLLQFWWLWAFLHLWPHHTILCSKATLSPPLLCVICLSFTLRRIHVISFRDHSDNPG